MHKMVDITQTGFVKGRQITEGFIYAQQILHYCKDSNIPLAIFKADIQKAFDTISWNFVQRVMLNLGFPPKWQVVIKEAVLQGTSQVIVNSLLGKKITLKRGVRQGDPLSPFLFIISMDFITRWFTKLINNGAIRLLYHGMKPCLLYADDALFFVKLETQQLQMLAIAFAAFKNISGLQVNLHKSELLLAHDSDTNGPLLAQMMGCRLGSFPFTYLGLPLSYKSLNQQAYLPLIQRFQKRLAGWSAK